MVMDSKKVIETLVKIAEKQQKIIQKLVEAQSLTPQKMEPSHAPKHPAQAILEALPPNVRALLTGSQVEVHDKAVTALVKPGQSDQTLDSVQKSVQATVSQLAQNNVLPPGSYTVSVQG